MMKKLLTIGLILLTVVLSSGTALAWRFFVAPPPLWGPPAVYYRGYYPPPVGYGPDYYGPYRVWVPGHWENRWTPSGWHRAWIPGYWEYRR